MAKLSVKIVVENNGKIAGMHHVLLFHRHSKVSDDEVPREQLIGFKSVHLGGRLPVTWYPSGIHKSTNDRHEYEAYSTTGYPVRTYRFYKGTKVYEFGYGLSYTKYSYKIASISHDKFHFNNQTTDKDTKDNSLHSSDIPNLGSEVCNMAKLSVKIVVEKNGKIAGMHHVLLFLGIPSHDKFHFNNQTTDKDTKDDSLYSSDIPNLGSEVCNMAKLSVKIVVENNGKIAGMHHVLLFLWHSKVSDDEVPREQLIGFNSVHLGGKLPVTWYPSGSHKSTNDRHEYEAYSITGYPVCTYRFFKGTKVYEFGYGLSYTKYSYKIASISHYKFHFNNQTTDKDTKDDSHYSSDIPNLGSEVAKISVKIMVENNGKIAGMHPVLLFLRHSKVSDDEFPREQLIGFKSVHLGGRLPVTWYPKEFIKVPLTDMNMRPIQQPDI
ncbi:hypothetical protein K7X08_023726 [Anisodus acutangulus]|uniref:Fibronectin type III-like domain-containing protein n=1 Tax=Anisodus acutangulus TaxID=402998 RepID=A0A9Q1QVS6_9SOLA|nr:hypothetical protein K7X08_023726 [Anisodus acutangulus]